MLLSIAAAAAGLLCRGGGRPHTTKGSCGFAVVAAFSGGGASEGRGSGPGSLGGSVPGRCALR